MKHNSEKYLLLLCRQESSGFKTLGQDRKIRQLALKSNKIHAIYAHAILYENSREWLFRLLNVIKIVRLLGHFNMLIIKLHKLGICHEEYFD